MTDWVEQILQKVAACPPPTAIRKAYNLMREGNYAACTGILRDEAHMVKANTKAARDRLQLLRAHVRRLRGLALLPPVAKASDYERRLKLVKRIEQLKQELHGHE